MILILVRNKEGKERGREGEWKKRWEEEKKGREKEERSSCISMKDLRFSVQPPPSTSKYTFSVRNGKSKVNKYRSLSPFSFMFYL